VNGREIASHAIGYIRKSATEKRKTQGFVTSAGGYFFTLTTYAPGTSYASVVSNGGCVVAAPIQSFGLRAKYSTHLFKAGGRFMLYKKT
jgi:hypothetical protein